MKHLNEITVKYKRKDLGTPVVDSSRVAADIAREIYKISDLQIDMKEYFFVLLLNRRNQLTGYFKLSEGGITGTVADLRLIFSTALKCLATGIVIIHNHPSGGLLPSDMDLELTIKVKKAAKMLDIDFMDHIIITSEGHYSFIDNDY